MWRGPQWPDGLCSNQPPCALLLFSGRGLFTHGVGSALVLHHVTALAVCVWIFAAVHAWWQLLGELVPTLPPGLAPSCNLAVEVQPTQCVHTCANMTGRGMYPPAAAT